MEEIAGLGAVDVGFAVPAFTADGVAAKFIFGFVEIDEAADEEVEAAVVVIIEPDSAAAPAGSCHAGFGGYVGEGAVAIIAIERIAERLRRRVEIAGAAVDQVDVHPAVVVVVEEAAAGADGFGEIPFGGAAVGVGPGDFCGGGRHFFEGGSDRWQQAGAACGEVAEAEAGAG